MNSTPTPPRPVNSGPAGTGAGGEALGERSFQHYQVLRREDGTPWELGRGTMGITYKALDTNLHSEVALKVVNSTLIDHPNARERFVREARAAAALRHRNVASVYHLGNDGEHFFYAMEFVDGETLDTLVRRQGPLPVGTALRIALQAARALAAAARQKLVHRDIKPANLMVVHEDADEHMVVKVIDFGLARPTATEGEDSGAGSLTIHGFVGTPQYASPEQLEEQTLDARSDIYSLGVTLWFLLTGKPPFSGSLAGICNQHLSKPPPWEALPASVPETVRHLLGHMLEKDPARRPQDAVELRREIDDCLAALHTPSPAPDSSDAPSSSPARRPMARLFAPGEVRRGDNPASRPAPAETIPSPAPLSPATGTASEVGTVLGGRFELMRLAGEGGSGRVFEALDRAEGNRTVAVKILRPGFDGSTQEERDRLREDARQISAAPHPHLVRMLAFESAPITGRAPSYVAEEWLHGFALRDLLAARNGALPAIECLKLLGQASKAADHASSRRLEHLEMGIHQIYLHFPPANPNLAPLDQRALSQMSLEEWPEWFLKIEPFSVSRDSGESGTWAGEVTILPGAPAAAALRSGQNILAPGMPGDGNPLAMAYLHALARLTYELLGGQLPARTASTQRTTPVKYVSLPTLNEAGNAVLARALSDMPGFDSAWNFFEALALACGLNATTLTPVALQSFDPFPPASPLAVSSLVPAIVPAPSDSSASETRVRQEATSVLPPPAAVASTSDTSSVTGAREADIGGLDNFSPVSYRSDSELPVEQDPWKESQLAQLLEEEEASKLVNPHSTGFALAAGAILGLVLLMAGFAVFAWQHEHRFVPAAMKHERSMAGKQDATSAAASKRRNVGESRAASPAPARLTPISTPPPLASKQPPVPVVPKAVAPLPASPLVRAEAPDPGAVPPPPAIASSSPMAAVAASGGTASNNPQPQPVLSPEEARQRPDPTPRFNDKIVKVQLNSDPAGAEVFLQGASLGKTPLNLTLPPGDYQFIARYRDWPEIHQDLHLADQQTQASTDIRLMSPSRLPLGSRFSPVLENRQRRRRFDRPINAEGDVPVAPAATAGGRPCRPRQAGHADGRWTKGPGGVTVRASCPARFACPGTICPTGKSATAE